MCVGFNPLLIIVIPITIEFSHKNVRRCFCTRARQRGAHDLYERQRAGDCSRHVG